MRRFAGMVGVLAIAMPAMAQTGSFVFNGGEGPGMDLRGERFSHGQFQQYAMPRDSRACAKQGCLVLANKSRDLVVTEFYVNDGEHGRDGTPKWRQNQLAGEALSTGLPPHRVAWWWRPPAMHCKFSVRAVLRDEKQARFELTGDYDTCATKGGFTVIAVDDAVRGDVEVLPAPSPSPPPPAAAKP